MTEEINKTTISGKKTFVPFDRDALGRGDEQQNGGISSGTYDGNLTYSGGIIGESFDVIDNTTIPMSFSTPAMSEAMRSPFQRRNESLPSTSSTGTTTTTLNGSDSLGVAGDVFSKERKPWNLVGSKPSLTFSPTTNLLAPPSNDSPSKDMSSSEKAMQEKQFLLACERGDIGSVRKLLECARKHPEYLDINCLDPLGRSALHIAIENENIEMIEVLLDANIETGDAILYAIGEENVEAVEIIIEHLEKINKFNPETQGVEINEHSAFTPDMTPIILAAHKDNYEIIKLLLDKKATVPHPHDIRCLCKDCTYAKSEDSLRLSRSRFNAYQALASPSLICLSARDPILYAFELSWELRRLSYVENEYRNEYQELSQKCQKFSVNMLDQVRGAKELEIVLNHTTNAWGEVAERYTSTEEVSHTLARLKLAIQLRQKRFVAHPNCQKLLTALWYDKLPFFSNRNLIYKLLIIIAVSIAYPILAVSYLIAPKSCIGSFIKKPFIKFICHSASYCYFLFLLILASQRIDYTFFFDLFTNDINGSESSKNEDIDRKETRGPPPTPVELAILIWVMGFIWVEIKQLWDSGLHEYMYDLWNILDFITNSLYLCTFALRAVAYYQVESEMRDPNMQHIGRKLHRKDWDAWDPTLISECMFATANIFSSLKLVHIFTVNPHLGPLKISLGRMVIDILKFFIVYCLVLFAFACGLNQLNWYYASMRQQECLKYKELLKMEDRINLNDVEIKNLEESCDPKYRSCASLFNTVETLFWALFGLIDLSHFNLKEEHAITEWTGKTIFGSYSCCSIIVLLNMLIAMMSNSYQYISDQSDCEWKFARSKLWMEYFDDTATLPPPFNIIPSPKSFYYISRWLCENIFSFSKKLQLVKQKSMRNILILKSVNQKENYYRRTLRVIAERESVFGFVSKNLIKRYIAQMQRRKQLNEGVSEDDVNEIKQDISAFRFELLGIFKNAGFVTGHSDITQKINSRAKRRAAMAERRMKGSSATFNLPIPEEWNSDKNSGGDSKVAHQNRPSRSDSIVNLANSLKLSNWYHLNKLRKRVSFRKSSGSSNTLSIDSSSGLMLSKKQSLSSSGFDRKESILEESEQDLRNELESESSFLKNTTEGGTGKRGSADAILKRLKFRKTNKQSCTVDGTTEELIL
uniref:ANK_REP_REGION domain-containing protein n=1 Tax=Strongyloides papillosus TaxID=174720 RepID=A0A0N5CG21_STREA